VKIKLDDPMTFSDLKTQSGIVIASRMIDELINAVNKVYNCDVM